MELICDISYWQSAWTFAKFELLKSWGMKAVIIRIGHGIEQDTWSDIFIDWCRRLKLPFGLYFYFYPGLTAKVQAEFFVFLAEQYPDAKCFFMDAEEYINPITDKPISYGTLDMFYHAIYNYLVAEMPGAKIGVYTGTWFVEEHCPPMTTWLKDVFGWYASYTKYFSWWAPFVEKYGGTWNSRERTFSGSNLPTMIAEIAERWAPSLPTGISQFGIWQAFTYLPISEFTVGQTNLDYNLISTQNLNEWFLTNEPIDEPIIIPEEKFMTERYQGKSPLLNVAFKPQMGIGADAHYNDCGPANVCMWIKTYTGRDITPDELYKQLGIAGDPLLSMSTLTNMLSLYDIQSTTIFGSSLGNLYTQLTAGKPFMALITYKPLVDANLVDMKTITKDFQHFVTVVGMDARYVRIHEPYTLLGKNIKVPMSAFVDCWQSADPRNSGITANLPVGKSLQPSTMTATSKADGSLNVRTGPGTNFSIVTSLPFDHTTIYKVSELTPDKLWAHLVNPYGWSAAWLMNIKGA